jgi:hypothetical protein
MLPPYFARINRGDKSLRPVRIPSGIPSKAPIVRIEARNGSNFSRIVKTDATGHYTSDGLAVGIYKVTLVVNGAVKASILNASTQSGSLLSSTLS